jgi:hypothetical protein
MLCFRTPILFGTCSSNPQMLDAGVLDFSMVGTERRIRIERLAAHKLKLYSDRRAAPAKLSASLKPLKDR